LFIISEPEMCKKTTTAIVVLFSCITLMGCDNKVSDSTLKGIVGAKRNQLARLVQLANEDRRITRIDFGYSSSSLPSQRWNEYRSLFREIGIKSGIERKEDFPSVIFFWVDCSGSALDTDCKGWAYSETPLSRLKTRLDYAPGVFFEAVSGGWYLFRDVD
jgi:hypothetical protein